MKNSSEIDQIIVHYKKIFQKYFVFTESQLNYIFAPDRLLVASIWLQLRKYHSLANKKFLNFLTILEFMALSMVQHESLNILEFKNNSDFDKKNKGLKNINKILLGDLLIVLAIQEINQLAQPTAKVFYDFIKNYYVVKIKNNLKNNKLKTPNNFLKFILFFRFYIIDNVNKKTKDEIDLFYNKLIESLNIFFKNKSKQNQSITKIIEEFNLSKIDLLETKFPVDIFINFWVETELKGLEQFI